MTISIKLKSKVPKKNKRSTNTNVNTNVLIPNKYIQLFNGCWIKYSLNSCNKIESGGFMYNFNLGIISLKIPRTNTELHLQIKDCTFYCNPELPQYSSLKFLLSQESRLEKMINRYTQFIIKNNIT